MEKANLIEIGRRLREYRQARGRWLTVRRLGKLAGVSHSVVSATERGLRRPTASYLYKAAPHLGVPPDQLLLLARYIDETGRWADETADPFALIAEQCAVLGLNAREVETVELLIRGTLAGHQAAPESSTRGR